MKIDYEKLYKARVLKNKKIDLFLSTASSTVWIFIGGLLIWTGLEIFNGVTNRIDIMTPMEMMKIQTIGIFSILLLVTASMSIIMIISPHISYIIEDYEKEKKIRGEINVSNNITR